MVAVACGALEALARSGGVELMVAGLSAIAAMQLVAGPPIERSIRTQNMRCYNILTALCSPNFFHFPSA
jgi:hypothetical protein